MVSELTLTHSLFSAGETADITFGKKKKKRLQPILTFTANVSLEVSFFIAQTK